ncbi:MAG TPA: hypothetical protein PKC89_02395 [Pyrinomonadaceae bacterium]|nr:hypothetical protein [Pyrinomonadaceae bacterium]
MDVRDLKTFLEGQLKPEDLVAQITSEVDEFRMASIKRGSSISVHVANENFRYSFGKEDVKLLCGALTEGRLNEWHIVFLCNVVEMSRSFVFESDEIEDLIFQLSNPEDDVSITSSWANSICNCK